MTLNIRAKYMHIWSTEKLKQLFGTSTTSYWSSQIQCDLFIRTSQSLETSIKGFLSFILLEWVELTDGGIFQWACGGGRQVITSWSHSRPTEQGMTLIQ